MKNDFYPYHEKTAWFFHQGKWSPVDYPSSKYGAMHQHRRRTCRPLLSLGPRHILNYSGMVIRSYAFHEGPSILGYHVLVCGKDMNGKAFQSTIYTFDQSDYFAVLSFFAPLIILDMLEHFMDNSPEAL